ncbi:DUF2851 family protein [Geofilum rubicundum]|nr:DUF2851 family protein [Geofilum rubicundum]
MNEHFLHHLWRFKLYQPGLYKTVKGEPIDIIHPGFHNTDAGPDFFNAKVKIGDTLWAGNIEIHQKSSDWHKHGHHTNRAFNNVILHVVTRHDREASTANGTIVPTWIMEIPPPLMAAYQQLKQSRHSIPCLHGIKQVDPFVISTWLERMMVEKLEIKVDLIQQLLKRYNNDWDEVLYVLLARNFGFGINADPFEQLARQTPWRVLLRNSDDLLRLEALLLGQAGFLTGLVAEEAYIQRLQKEYHHLRHKYGLSPMPAYHWKFLRLRPSNFPTIRLVQMAALFHKNRLSLDKIMKAPHTKTLSAMLNVSLEGYWLTHYRPEAPSPHKIKRLGPRSGDLIIINTLAPLVYGYGQLRDNERLKDLALHWLESIAPEENAIVNRWRNMDIRINSAFQTQALIHLTQKYCRPKRCLHCRLGHLILASHSSADR